MRVWSKESFEARVQDEHERAAKRGSSFAVVEVRFDPEAHDVPSQLDRGAAALIGKDASRRRRFFGITSVSTIETNAKFVTHYNESFTDKITRTTAPNTSYDAFYLLAYAVHVTAARAPRGATSRARASARTLRGPSSPAP